MHVEIDDDYLAPVWSWYTNWCNPVIAKMYIGDREAVHQLLAAAWCALDANGLDDDRRQSAYYRLCYVDWQIPLRLGSLEEAAAGYRHLLDRLAEPPAGPLSIAFQLRMLLQTRCHADSEGLAPFDIPDYLDLRRRLSQCLRDAELYHFVASWAFKRRDLEALEEALEVLTFNPTGYQSDFSWQRVNLMYLLVQERATQRDVLELIKRMSFPHHWRVVRTTLWEAVLAAGLADEKVELALSTKLELLHAMPPMVPGHADSTLRIRKDL
jgi:hypothetical protein